MDLLIGAQNSLYNVIFCVINWGMKIHEWSFFSWRCTSRSSQEGLQRILDGVTQIEMAKIFGLTRQAVGKWVAACREGGLKALKREEDVVPKVDLFCRGRLPRLLKWSLIAPPDQLKLPFYLWTRVGVSLQKRCGPRRDSMPSVGSQSDLHSSRDDRP